MKKLLITFSIISFTFSLSKAQQIPQFSEYMLNKYILNPGVTGVKGYYEVKANYRKNWTGFKGSPVTQTLSFNGPVKKDKNMGIGGFIFNDMTGPVQRIGAEASYSYHFPVLRNSKLSIGVSAGAYNFRIAKEELKLETQTDKAIQANSLSVVVPDARMGIHLHNRKYFAGFSVPQLIPSRIKFTDYDRAKVSHLIRHYYLMGGYHFNINDIISVVPSLYFKTAKSVPIQVDINSRFYYDNKYWVGFSYRTNDALVGLLGLTVKENFHFAYSYDYTISDLQSYNYGSHEIMIGYDFGKEKGRQPEPRL